MSTRDARVDAYIRKSRIRPAILEDLPPSCTREREDRGDDEVGFPHFMYRMSSAWRPQAARDIRILEGLAHRGPRRQVRRRGHGQSTAPSPKDLPPKRGADRYVREPCGQRRGVKVRARPAETPRPILVPPISRALAGIQGARDVREIHAEPPAEYC